MFETTKKPASLFKYHREFSDINPIGNRYLRFCIKHRNEPALLYSPLRPPPFPINYYLAVTRRKKTSSLMLLLTLIFSWLVTLILAFIQLEKE